MKYLIYCILFVMVGCVAEEQPKEYSAKFKSIGISGTIIEIQRGNKKYIVYSNGNGVCKLDEEIIPVEVEQNPKRPEGLLE